MKHSLFNIRLDVLSREEALLNCRKFFAESTCRTLCFLNAHCFNLAQSDAAYAEAINHADLLLNDGIGIEVVSKFAGVRLRENLNGTDLIPQILEIAADTNIPVYLLGGREGVAGQAAEALSARIPMIEIAGFRSGYFGMDEEEQVVDAINHSGAALVVLGMGVPRQELWAARNAGRLPDIRMLISGGAILDFLSGAIPRAPGWMRYLRLEWLFRLCLEPGRMWQRYIWGSFVLLANIVRLRAFSGSTSQS